jgi:hypothetical protein
MGAKLNRMSEWESEVYLGKKDLVWRERGVREIEKIEQTTNKTWSGDLFIS